MFEAGRRIRAFTLIELLVVVAILTILLAMLTPSLKRARELAWTTVCATNQKVHGTAVHQFAATYAWRFPPSTWSRPSGGYSWRFDMPYWEFDDSASAAGDSGSMVNGESFCEDFKVNTFFPFYRSIATGKGWICPGHPHAAEAGKSPYTFGHPDSKSYQSAYRTYYLMNKQVCPGWKPCGPYMSREKRRLDDILKPHALFLWADRRDYANDIDPDRTDCEFSVYVNVTSSNTNHGPDDIGVHHQGGFNASFVDGHVQKFNMNMDPAKPGLFIDSMSRPPLKVENFRYN